MKAPSQRRRVNVFVVGDMVWIIAIRKLSSKSVLCNYVCRHGRIESVGDGKVVVIFDSEIQRTTCFPPHRMPGRVYTLGYIRRLRFDRFLCAVE